MNKPFDLGGHLAAPPTCRRRQITPNDVGAEAADVAADVGANPHTQRDRPRRALPPTSHFNPIELVDVGGKRRLIEKPPPPMSPTWSHRARTSAKCEAFRAAPHPGQREVLRTLLRPNQLAHATTPGEVPDGKNDRDDDHRERQQPRPPAVSCKEHLNLRFWVRPGNGAASRSIIYLAKTNEKAYPRGGTGVVEGHLRASGHSAPRGERNSARGNADEKRRLS
jgi:hypothetical protein